MTLARAARLAVSADLLTLDAFDTLLRRSVEPGVVAERAAALLAPALAQLAGVEVTPGQILEHRRGFARLREAPYPSQEVEWSIGEWLLSLAAEHRLVAAAARALVEAGRAAELDAETASTTPRLTGELLARARALLPGRGAAVLLSDTTLDAPLLRRLVEAHGLAAPEVVASCDEGASKRRGTAFAPLAGRRGAVAPAHVGDNPKVDLLRPTQAGWRAAWIPVACPTSDAREVARLLDDMPRPPGGSPVEALAAGPLATLVGCFAAWIAREERRLRADSTLFLARDARGLLAAAQRLSPSLHRSYARLSRRIVAVAHPDDLLRHLSLSGKVGKRSLAAFVAGFGLEPDDEAALLSSARRFGAVPDAPPSPSMLEAWRRALDAESGRLDLIRRQRLGALQGYITSLTGAPPDARFVVVDLGWAGTIQDVLQAALPRAEVHGRYAGLTRGGRPPTARSTKQGLVWDLVRGESGPPLARSAGVMRLWELLLREPTGTAHRLVTTAGAVSVETDEATAPGASGRALANEVEAGLEAGLGALEPWLRALVDCRAPETDMALARAARIAWTRLSLLPTPDAARVLLDHGMDEGATRGVTTSLGRGGLVEGVTWWPGLLASTLGRRRP
jgi:hypothetical protein